MPVWTYRCPCGKTEQVAFKSWQERDAAEAHHDQLRCLSCGDKMAREASSGSFILRGRGFHCNDYGKGR